MPIDCAPLPSDEFATKSASWEKGLKWRLVQRPGGAFIQPDDWYRLHAAATQARRGGTRCGAARPRNVALTPGLLLILPHPFLCRPPRATTPRSGPCGRTTAGSTSTGARVGTRGRSSRRVCGMRARRLRRILLAIVGLPSRTLFSRGAAQGTGRDEAVAKFCRVYAEAHTQSRAKANFF